MPETTRGPRWLKRIAVAALLFIVLDCVWVVALRIWAEVATTEATAASGDGIAVLYSDFGPELDRTTRSLERAIALRSGTNVPILCIGGNRQASAQRWGQAMTHYLREQAVAPEAIIAEQTSYDTRSNIRSLLEIARGRGLHSIVIVAHPAHAPRVRHHWALQANGETAVVVLPTPPKSTAASIADFWLTAQHEALAWVGLLLPDSWEDRIIRSIRR